MTCPHCKTPLTDHETFAPKSGGALHCFECGCCFLLDGKTPRPGVPVCDRVEETPPELRKRVLSDLKIGELLELAKQHDITVPDGAKKPDVFKLLKDAKVQPGDAPEGSEDDAPDFDEMDAEEMSTYAEEHDITVPDGLDEDALRVLLKGEGSVGV